MPPEAIETPAPEQPQAPPAAEEARAEKQPPAPPAAIEAPAAEQPQAPPAAVEAPTPPPLAETPSAVSPDAARTLKPYGEELVEPARPEQPPSDVSPLGSLLGSAQESTSAPSQPKAAVAVKEATAEGSPLALLVSSTSTT